MTGWPEDHGLHERQGHGKNPHIFIMLGGHVSGVKSVSEVNKILYLQKRSSLCAIEHLFAKCQQFSSNAGSRTLLVLQQCQTEDGMWGLKSGIQAASLSKDWNTGFKFNCSLSVHSSCEGGIQRYRLAAEAEKSKTFWRADFCVQKLSGQQKRA